MKIYALVIYDIVNDKRRTRFAKKLNQYGIRVQKSAFEVYLSKTIYKRMISEISRMIDTDEDSLRIYRLNEQCELELVGQNPQLCRESCSVI